VFNRNTVKALSDFGLNNLEANVYLTLLKNPGVTGYRIARELGKAVSNVYQALESLTVQGVAIQKYEGKDRTYSPLPIKEVISLFKSNHENRIAALEDELKEFESPVIESAIYKINSSDQLFNKIASLLEEVKSSVLITADSFFLKRLQPQLESAGKKGRTILILGYEDLEFENCDFLKLSSGKRAPWPGHWIIMDIDGVQHLIAFFEKPDTLTHAIWCNDQYVSYWIHFFMLADFALMTFFEEAHDKEEYREIFSRIRDIYNKYTHHSLNLARYYSDSALTKELPD